MIYYLPNQPPLDQVYQESREEDSDDRTEEFTHANHVPLS